MSKVLVIGCGGVASVAIRKCCQVSEVFTELCIASRTKSKCDKLAERGPSAPAGPKPFAPDRQTRRGACPYAPRQTGTPPGRRCGCRTDERDELAPMLDASGVSTAAACKTLRELILALYKN